MLRLVIETANQEMVNNRQALNQGIFILIFESLQLQNTTLQITFGMIYLDIGRPYGMNILL